MLYHPVQCQKQNSLEASFYLFRLFWMPVWSQTIHGCIGHGYCCKYCTLITSKVEHPPYIIHQFITQPQSHRCTQKQTKNTAESDRALPGVLMKTMKSCNWSCISQVRWWIRKGTEAIKGRGRYTPTGRCFQRMVLALEWFDMFWYVLMLLLYRSTLPRDVEMIHVHWLFAMSVKKNCLLTCVSSIAMLSVSSLQNLVWSHGGKIDHLGTNLIYSF